MLPRVNVSEKKHGKRSTFYINLGENTGLFLVFFFFWRLWSIRLPCSCYKTWWQTRQWLDLTSWLTLSNWPCTKTAQRTAKFSNSLQYLKSQELHFLNNFASADLIASPRNKTGSSRWGHLNSQKGGALGAKLFSENAEVLGLPRRWEVV